MTEPSSPVTTAEQELLERLDAGYPPEWRAKEPGDYIVGAFLRLETGPTQFGPAPILILGTSEGERSLWVFVDSLKHGLQRAAPAPGELLAIRYMGRQDVKNPKPGRRKDYHSYQVAVLRPLENEREVNWDTAFGVIGGEREESVEDEQTPF